VDNRAWQLECNMADKDAQPGRIAVNRRARHEYFIEERLEAGVALQGSLRKRMCC
jgi:tmRNA-binding protein